MDRRAFLYTVSGATVVSLAGCSGGGEEAENDDENEQTGTADGEDESTDEGGEESTDGEQEESTDGEDESTDDGEEEEEAEEEEANTVDATIGSVVRSSTMELVVEQIERGVDVEGFTDPERGNEFVDLHVAFRNRSDDFIAVDGFFDTVIRDDDGGEYGQQVLKQAPSFNTGTYAPGELDRAVLTYEIPQDAEEIELFWEPSGGPYDSVESVTVDLTEETDVEPWTMDLGVDVNDLGTTVESGDFRMTVHGLRTESSVGRGAASPDLGNEFVVVDLEVEHLADSQTPIVDERMVAFTMKGNDGRSFAYDEGASAFLQEQFDLRAPLAAGETRRGEVVYELPQDVDPLYYAFDFSLYTEGDKAFWQLR